MKIPVRLPNIFSNYSRNGLSNEESHINEEKSKHVTFAANRGETCPPQLITIIVASTIGYVSRTND